MSFDTSYFINPIYKYLQWLILKIKYQLKYRKEKLRISYKSFAYNSTFGRYNWIGENSIVIDLTIGDYSYISANSSVNNCEIGKFCSIGPNVKIAPGNHPTGKFVSTHPVTYSKPAYMLNSFTADTVFEGSKRVIIGNDVWIGANCLIVDGVVIGDGAIIAANSVVVKDVEPYLIIGGVPGKPIRKRFDDDEIAKLLEFKWWNKDDAWIREHITKFWDIKEFIKSI